MDIDYKSLSKKVSMCILADCPVSSQCLRYIVRTKYSPENEEITIMNPDAIVISEQGCQFFKSTATSPFGIGFKHYLEELTIVQSKIAREVLYSHFNSRTQFYRYRDGVLRISPSRKEHLDKILSEAGLPELKFDSIVYDIE